MGHLKHTTEGHGSTRGRCLGWRVCLRKGCGRRYQARHWRQRYCHQPECMRELRRWQAAKRQRRRRATAEGRRIHAQAERERRLRKKCRPTVPSEAVGDGARGHAIKNFRPGRSAIGPAVSSPSVLLCEPRHTTAATSAARPCVACGTGSASTSPARAWPVA